MLRMFAVVALSIVVIVLGAACGGDDDDAGSDDEALPEDDLAESLLLELSDFPNGWTETAQEEEDESAVDDALEDCGIEDDLAPGIQGRAETGDFTEDGTAEITHQVAIFENSEQAIDALSQIEARGDCITDFFREGGIDEDDVEVTDATFGDLSFDEFGDESRAYRLSVEVESEGLSPSFYIDFVAVAVGRVASVVTAADILSPYDTEQLATFVSTAADRASTAAE